MSTIDEKLLISISRIRNMLFRDLENIFRENLLTGTQFSVLEVLLHKGDLSVGEIQKFVLGTNGNIPLVVKNLERDGLVCRRKIETDARVSIVSLTDEGEKLVKKVYPLQKERLKFLFEDFDLETKEKLFKNLIELYSSIENKRELI